MRTDWQRHVLASSGYLELGMFDDAALALEEIEPEDKTRTEVLESAGSQPLTFGADHRCRIARFARLRAHLEPVSQAMGLHPTCIYARLKRSQTQSIIDYPKRCDFVLLPSLPPRARTLGLGHAGEGHQIGHRKVSSRDRGKNRRESAKDV